MDNGCPIDIACVSDAMAVLLLHSNEPVDVVSLVLKLNAYLVADILVKYKLSSGNTVSYFMKSDQDEHPPISTTPS